MIHQPYIEFGVCWMTIKEQTPQRHVLRAVGLRLQLLFTTPHSTMNKYDWKYLCIHLRNQQTRTSGNHDNKIT